MTGVVGAGGTEQGAASRPGAGFAAALLAGALFLLAAPPAMTQTGAGTDRVVVSKQVLVLDEGDSATYTVRLNTRPDGTVTVTPTSADSSAVTVSPPSLTFDAATWKAPQTVTLRSVVAVDFRNKQVDVGHAVSGYRGVTSAAAVTVLVTDTGTGTDRVAVSDQVLAVDEGGSATYTVRLDNRPGGRVTVTPASADAGAVAVSPPWLIFDAENWKTAQTVTVSGVADRDLADETAVQVTHAVSGYGVATADPVEVTVTDTGTGTDRVVVSTDRLTIGEQTGGHPYAVRLDTRPGGTVTVAVTSSDTGVAELRPRTLSFDAANWKVSQTVTVFGVPDRDADDETAQITHKVSGYGAVTSAAPVAVTLLDPDGPVDVQFAPPRLVVEEGAETTYTVTIEDEEFAPTLTPLWIRPSSGDLNAVTVSPDDLAFRYAGEQWKTPQTVTVRGVPDADLDDETVTITHSLFRFTHVRPDPYPGDPVTVVVTDTGTGTNRVAVSESRLAIDEGGSATYTVRLDNRPAGRVTLWGTSPDPDAVTVTPYRLDFDAKTWKQAQTVTVSGVADTDLDDEAVTITHAVWGYPGVTSADPVKVAVTDTGSGTDRVVVSESRLAVDEGGSVTYTLRLDSRPGGTVTVKPESDDRSAATATPRWLTFDATNWKTPRTVTVRGVADADRDDEAVQVTHAVSGYGSVTTADPGRGRRDRHRHGKRRRGGVGVPPERPRGGTAPATRCG